MTTVEKLFSVLRKVRRRLRWQAAAEAARKGLWAGAALIGVVGATHLLLRALPAAWAGAALLPPAVWLAVAALRVPGLGRCAAAADRLAGADALFLSALDQAGRAPAERAGGAGLLAARAERTAADLEGTLRRADLRRWMVPLWSPALLTTVLTCLLFFPGRAPSPADPGETSVPASVASVAANSPLVAYVRAQGASAGGADGGEAAAKAASRSDRRGANLHYRGPEATAAHRTGAGDAAGADLRGEMGGGGGTSGPGSGRAPGTGDPGDGARPGADGAEVLAVRTARVPVPVAALATPATRGTGPSPGEGPVPEFAVPTPETGDPSPPVATVPPLTGLDAPAHLRPGLRVFVDAYLRTMGGVHDP